MRTSIFRGWAALPFILFPAQSAQASTAQPAPPLIAYYSGWYGDSQVHSIPWDLVTQVNVAFAGIDPNFHCAWMNLDASDTADNTELILRAVHGLVRARDARNPRVKIVISVGGEDLSYRFSRAVAQADSLHAMANSCAAMVRDYKLDGIDYDWEFPGRLGKPGCPDNHAAPWPCYDSANDARNFTALLAATRQALPADAILSAAVSANAPDAVDNIDYDYAGLQEHVTFVNVMAYSIKGWLGDPTTGHGAPMGRAVASLRYFNAQGISRTKLILGVPFYGTLWTQVSSPRPGAPGVTQGELDYDLLLDRYGKDPACSLHRDPEGAYYYCPDGEHARSWVSVDDPTTLWRKASYAREQGYGGVMFWAWPGDTEEADLTRALWRGLRGDAGSK